MEPVFWVLAGILGVLWLVWRWGKEAGLSEAQAKSRQNENRAQREHDAQVTGLEKKNKELVIEAHALQAALNQIKRHRDALNGAVPLLADLKANKPSWLTNTSPFLLLGPGRLYELASWAFAAEEIWRDIDRLSRQSRIGLEQECNAVLDSASVVVREDAPDLMRRTLECIAGRPLEFSANLFELSADQFVELGAWLQELAAAAVQYVAKVDEIERHVRQQQTRDATRATLN